MSRCTLLFGITFKNFTFFASLHKSVQGGNPGISVNPTGTTLQFTATGTYSNSSTQNLTSLVSWSSADATKATVSNAAGTNGKATSLAAGTTTITATLGSVFGTTTLTVTSATLLSIAVTPVDPQILVGGVIQLTATGTYSDGSTLDLSSLVTWSSSNTSKATVINGLVSGVAVGTSSITATSGSISSDPTEIEVE